MNSRIYVGKVMHARHAPVRHRWVFPFYFYAIDLDELNELHQRVRGFSHNRWAPVSLRDDDYLRGAGALRERLSDYVDVDALDCIILITVARFMTRVFNPVSFYYGLKKDGSPACIIAEVNNTFGERHIYVMECDGHFPVKCSHAKAFHVSPFNNMEGEYEFSFSSAGESMNIGIRLVRNGETVMDAAMWGEGRALTTGTLWRTILRHPFTAALTMPRILWQAALLRFRMQLPVFKKPAPSSPMTMKVKS